jgi:hypothetical protein
MKLASKQFDINVWNRGAYYTAHLKPIEQYDEWVLCPYTIVDDGHGGYGTGQEREDLNLVLTPKEWTQLTLGKSIDEGGAYISDDDFFLDSYSFEDMYSLPASVRVWIDFVSAVL